jgi:hypothetical protein
MKFAERFLSSQGVTVLSGRSIKRYHMNVHDRPIEPEIVERALAIVPRLLPEADETTPPASWLILHRGLAAAYVLAYSWVWDNVISVRSAAAGEPFLGCPDRDPANFVLLDKPWVGCVWELGPFEHERSAWVRHLIDTDAPDVQAYLADFAANGPTGGARLRTTANPG